MKRPGRLELANGWRKDVFGDGPYFIAPLPDGKLTLFKSWGYDGDGPDRVEIYRVAPDQSPVEHSKTPKEP